MKPWEKYQPAQQPAATQQPVDETPTGPWQKYQTPPPEEQQQEGQGFWEQRWDNLKRNLARGQQAGLAEPALTLGTAGAGEVTGGLRGLWELLTTGDPEAAEVARAETTEALSYEPKTAGGQLATQVVTATSAAPAAALQKAEELSGEAGYQIGGPTGGALASTIPTLATMMAGGLSGRSMLRHNKPGGKLPASPEAESPQPKQHPQPPVDESISPRFRQIADQIKAGSTDAEIAPYRLDKWSGVGKDRAAKQVVKQGFDESVVSAIKAASPSTRQKMTRMLAIRERSHSNARYAMDNRASDVAGDSLMQRVQHVKRVNQNAGKQLDSVAKTLKGKPVDYRAPVGGFLAKLRDMGVTMDRQLKPSFAGSDIEGVDAAERVVRNIIGRMKNTQAPDAYDLHRLKRYIDEQVTYGKNKDGLGGKTERILKKLRADLDSTLDSNFPEYDRVNTRYSDTVNAMDTLQDSAGGKVNLYGENADKAVGTVLRRLMSNTQSRVNLMDAIDGLESVAGKYGAKFNDDLKTQMLFADQLDKRFGATARTSLQGEIEKGVRSAASVALGQQSVTGAAVDAAAGGIKKLRGVSDRDAFKSMRELLRER